MSVNLDLLTTLKKIAEERHPRREFFSPIAFDKLYQSIKALLPITCQVVTETMPGVIKANGSAFLIGPNLLMTNRHVLPDITTAEKSFVIFFSFLETGSKLIHLTLNRVALCPHKEKGGYFFTGFRSEEARGFLKKELDYAIIGIEPNEEIRKVSHLAFSLFKASAPKLGEKVFILHHPDIVDATTMIKGALMISIGVTQSIIQQEDEIHYNTDTAAGSSGGPVVSIDGELVGLHYQGGGACSCSANNHSCNAGIPIISILDHIPKEELDILRERLPGYMLLGISTPSSVIATFSSYNSESEFLSQELAIAEKSSDQARQTIKRYTEGQTTFDALKEKIEEAFVYYQEISDATEDENLKREISIRTNLLKWEWYHCLFSYACSYCIHLKLCENNDIEKVKDYLGTFDPRKSQLENFHIQLQRFLKTYNEYLKKNNIIQEDSNTKKLIMNRDIAKKDMIEARLFLTAVLNELLEKQEEAAEGYFRLAEYHTIAASQDETMDRSLITQACFNKAYSLETRKERESKGHLIHREFVESLKKIRSRFLCNSFSCFISYDVNKNTEEWILKFLYRDLITLGIRPIARALSQESGKHEVEYGRQIRDAEVTVILCSPDMKQKYENFLRGITSDAKLGIEMEFLKDRYLNGKDLHNTFHIHFKGEWSEAAFSNLPAFFQRKNLVNFCERKGLYTNNLPYFENAIGFFCDLLKVPENDKNNFLKEFIKKTSEIERHPFLSDKNILLEEFLETQKTIPPFVPKFDPSKNRTQLIGIPNTGTNFQPREKVPLESLFKNSNHLVLTQELSTICGTGKTHLAAQYAHVFASKYNYVLWVEGKDQATIEDSILRITQRVQKEDSSVQDIKSFIDWVEKTPGILLIFDSILNPETLFPYLPNPDSANHILITSRHKKWPDSWEVISLGLFTLDEGKNLLAKITGKREEQASEDLVEFLEHIPSLISQAGYLLKGSNDAPSLYQTIIESENAAKSRSLASRSNLPVIPKHFAGRKVYLAAIYEILCSNSSSTIILQAPLSLGKTSLAFQYAFENVHQFKLIWYFPCGNAEALKKSILQLANRLKISPQNDDKLTLSKIYQTIEKLKEKTLFIFDDLFQTEILPPSIPELHILVTSQEKDWCNQFYVLPISPLTKNDALFLLRQFVDNETAHMLSGSLDLFMGNPLALSIAAHCIKASKVDPKTYLNALEAQIGNSHTLDALFLALWEETQKTLFQMPKMSGEEKLLDLIKQCVFSSTHVASKKDLEKWLQEALRGQKLDPEKDPIHIVLRDLLTRLSKFFILDHKEEFVSIHPLVAKAIKSKMITEEQQLIKS